LEYVQKALSMTDIEFDVIDELYFVTPFDTLADQVAIPEQELKQTLQNLLAKGWIKCFKTASEELMPAALNFDKEYRQYYFLATKAGLLAHNSK
jgi:DNA-binding Lrp family transcriptional regulator